jgi:hypothetical protein
VPQALRLVSGVLAEQALECGDDALDRALPAARVAARVGRHEPMVGVAAPVVVVGEGTEVGDVLGEDRAPLPLRGREELGIGERAQLRALGHRLHIVAATAPMAPMSVAETREGIERVRR